MNQKHADTTSLESVFEEILEEFHTGKRDKAAELQAKVIAESNHPDDLFRAYQAIRAKKSQPKYNWAKKADEEYRLLQRKAAERKARTQAGREMTVRSKFLVGVLVAVLVGGSGPAPPPCITRHYRWLAGYFFDYSATSSGVSRICLPFPIAPWI